MSPPFSSSSSSRSIPRGIIRDIALIAIGILAIWAGLYVAFGMTNPFYVVASGSMIPELQVYDVLIVQGRVAFEDLKIGDVIVFDRPSDHNRVIVHRIVSVIDEDPRTLRTKGDANRASIPGTDFPITEAEYIGKVDIVVPEVGYVTQALKPPVNYIIIAVIIGVMISKQFLGRTGKDAAEESGSEGKGDAGVDGADGGSGIADAHRDDPAYYGSVDTADDGSDGSSASDSDSAINDTDGDTVSGSGTRPDQFQDGDKQQRSN